MNFLLLLALLPAYVYPVKVQVVDTHYKTVLGFASGHGSANLYDDHLGPRGVDYAFSGCVPFAKGPVKYYARWQSDRRLVILIPEIGSDRTHECILRVTLHDYLYVPGDNGGVATVPVHHEGGTNATN